MFRLRRGNEVQPRWHRSRDDALRSGIALGWTIEEPRAVYNLAEGVDLEEGAPGRSKPPT
jgi:hypothetical protein